MKYILLVLFISISSSFMYSQDERITIVGDSLVGKYINGENIREIHGNVVMTQGEVRITCNKAIQYLDKNEAVLTGNVIATQDTITIFTDRAFYYGDDKYTYSDSPVKLYDGHVTLTALTGYYYFDYERAEFFNEVKLVDSLNTLEADELFYYNNLDRAVSIGSVRIYDEKSEIRADSLIHLRNDDRSFAFSNIRISYPESSVIITGNYLQDEGRKNYTYISGEPVLTQVDTSAEGKVDTLIVLSETMEAYQDSTNKLIASDSVRIVRGDFFSVNEYSLFLRNDDKIITYKPEEKSPQPIIWFDNSQLIGDTIRVSLNKNNIDWIDISGNSFILSKVKGYENRFDQISGKHTKMLFENNDLKRTEVEGNVLSFYYLFEEEVANGVLKSSSERAVLVFEDNTIVDVNLYGSIKSEYHPENLVIGKEKSFTLPSFIIHNNRPDKEEILNTVPNFKNEKQKQYDYPSLGVREFNTDAVKSPNSEGE